MRNRLLRVTGVTLIIYIFYTFFFIEDVSDSPVIKKIILVESSNVEIEKDTLLLVKDSLFVIKKE